LVDGELLGKLEEFEVVLHDIKCGSFRRSRKRPSRSGC
jgi:hypothetical protein